MPVPYSLGRDILSRIAVGVRRIPIPGIGGAITGVDSAVRGATTGYGDVRDMTDEELEALIQIDTSGNYPPYNIPGLVRPTGELDERGFPIYGEYTAFEAYLGRVLGRARTQRDVYAAQARTEALQRDTDEMIRQMRNPPLQVTVTQGQQPKRKWLQRLRGFFTPLRIAGIVGAAVIPRLSSGSSARVTGGIDPLTQPPLEDRARQDYGIDSLARALSSPQNRYCETQRKKKRAKRRRCKQRANVAWTSGPRKGHIAGTKCLQFE